MRRVPMQSRCALIVVLIAVLSASSVHCGPVRVPQWQYVGSTLLGPIEYLTSSEGIASTEEMFLFNGRQVTTTTDFAYHVIEPGFQALSIPLELREMGYDHLGDGDIFEGVLYQCLERQHYDTYTNATLLTYNAATLEWTGDYAQTLQMHMPWVAVNPDTQELFSSDWSPINYLYVYDLTMTQIRLLPLSVEITEAQGGGFFEGLLYISCNDDNVYIFNPDTGDLVDSFASGFDAEMEGLTFANLRNQSQGILHILDGNVGTPWEGSNHMLYHYDFIQ